MLCLKQLFSNNLRRPLVLLCTTHCNSPADFLLVLFIRFVVVCGFFCFVFVSLGFVCFLLVYSFGVVCFDFDSFFPGKTTSHNPQMLAEILGV